MFSSLFVCLSVSQFVCLSATLRKNSRTDLNDIFTEGRQWPMNKWLNFRGDPITASGYRDCFPDSSLLGDTESGINRLHCATLQCWAGITIATVTSLRHRPLAEVCTVAVFLATVELQLLAATTTFTSNFTCAISREVQLTTDTHTHTQTHTHVTHVSHYQT